MTPQKTTLQKRRPFTVAALLSGVALAGLVSTVMGAPQGHYDFLHDHLEKGQAAIDITWTAQQTKLKDQDKRKIAELIERTESAQFTPRRNEGLHGQALSQALATHCVSAAERCMRPVRIGRTLAVSHVNGDLRVANIKEQSLRIDFETGAELAQTRFLGIVNETRNLRFYQTQGGWVQNNTQTLSKTPLIFEGREDKFAHLASHNFVGLNYYPASASWADFWTEFPLAEIHSDLEKASGLNVNALRIFLTHDYFDDPKTRDEAIEKLKVFLDLCHDKDIKVLITLFDLRPDYSVSNWAADIRHIDRVLSTIFDHAAILGIDLKNQPDLDFPHWGESLVEGWLTVMARHIQIQYPDLAVMTGWSDARHALRLQGVFDVVTYHEYQNPKGFKSRLEAIKAKSGGKPVMITELGSTTWHPPFIRSVTEKAQAKRLGAQLDQSANSNGVFVWTLNDFDHVGTEVVGRLPWRKAQQRHFGLHRDDGSARPAAATLKAYGAKKSQQNYTHLISTLNLRQK